MTIKVGSIVKHPFMIGKDNKPLKGKIIQVESLRSNWEVLWDRDKKPEVCDRSDFTVPRKRK